MVNDPLNVDFVGKIANELLEKTKLYLSFVLFIFFFLCSPLVCRSERRGSATRKKNAHFVVYSKWRRWCVCVCVYICKVNFEQTSSYNRIAAVTKTNNKMFYHIHRFPLLYCGLQSGCDVDAIRGETKFKKNQKNFNNLNTKKIKTGITKTPEKLKTRTHFKSVSRVEMERKII